jgi:hypothetical protein
LRLLGDKKGQVRVIEAFFASVLLMSCLTLIPAQPNLKNSTENLASTAQNVLLSLDSDGHLATLIDNRDWAALKSSIESAVPLTFWFNLTVFDKDMHALNAFPICNAGAVSDKIASIDYVCVSRSSDYTIYTLRFQLSLVD